LEWRAWRRWISERLIKVESTSTAEGSGASKSDPISLPHTVPDVSGKETFMKSCCTLHRFHHIECVCINARVVFNGKIINSNRLNQMSEGTKKLQIPDLIALNRVFPLPLSVSGHFILKGHTSYFSCDLYLHSLPLFESAKKEPIRSLLSHLHLTTLQKNALSITNFLVCLFANVGLNRKARKLL